MSYEEEKQKTKKKCGEVFDYANKVIADNEKVVDTQSIVIVIGSTVLVLKAHEAGCLTEGWGIFVFVMFVTSIILCLIAPTWFITRRRILQEKIETIIKNHYKKENGKIYRPDEIEKSEKKYIGWIIPIFRIHILEFLRLIFVIVFLISAGYVLFMCS